MDNEVDKKPYKRYLLLFTLGFVSALLVSSITGPYIRQFISNAQPSGVPSSVVSKGTEANLPKFGDYLQENDVWIPGQKPAPVDLTSHPDASMYRTYLRLGAAKGPNFADHFTVIEIGCGTECQKIAVVNALNGKVYFPDFTASYGTEYDLMHRLLIVDPPQRLYESYGNDWPDWALSRYYVWQEDRFEHLGNYRVGVSVNKVSE